MAVAVDRIEAALRERADATESWLCRQAHEIAGLCGEMAERFAAGGRLLALADSPQGTTDAQHVAVEFVHPVIVGKRALPALALTAERGELLRQVELLATPGDMVIAFTDGNEGGVDEIAAAIGLATQRGCLTIAFDDRLPASRMLPLPAGTDAYVTQEMVETAYHVLWELVHVFFEHGVVEAARGDAGAASFLYPFLDDAARSGAGTKARDELVADVARSTITKARQSLELRVSTVQQARSELHAAADAIRTAADAGATVLTLGNGGSATDAADLASDLQSPPAGRIPRAAVNLAADPSIITALANDIGPDDVFARQVAAHARRGDVVVAFSTSGGSRNVVAALATARARACVTVAFLGSGGGRVAADRLADHVVVVDSQHVPRIQEAQSTAAHVLCDLVGTSRDR